MLTDKSGEKLKSKRHTSKLDTLVTIGRVIKAHGLYGEVKVEPLSNISKRFKIVRKITLELKSGELIQFDVEHSRIIGFNVILKLNGKDNREEAEKLRGAYVYVTLDRIAPLDKNSYYSFDLEGLEVFDSSNKKIGIVKRVEQYPANDIIVVENETEEILIPAIKEFVVGVDIEAKKLTVNLPEGLPTYPKRC